MAREAPTTARRHCQQLDHARHLGGKGLADIRDIFVADDVGMEVSRLAFGADGMLYMSIGRLLEIA